MRYGFIIAVISVVRANDPLADPSTPIEPSPESQAAPTDTPAPALQVTRKEEALIPEDYAGVVQTVNDFSESANSQRYLLQNTLIHNEPILKARLQDALANLTNMYEKLQESNAQVYNQSLVLNADASAGGLLATSRALFSEVPATQKLMQKVVYELIRAISQTAQSINETLHNTELDYQARIQSKADSVASLLVQQDRAFAQQAAAQKRAMVRASGQLRKQALAEAEDLKMTVNSTQTKLKRLSGSISAFSKQTSSSLDQLSALPNSVQSQLQATASDVEDSVQSSLADSQHMAEARMRTSTESSLLNVENAGAELSKQLMRQVNKTQANVTNNLGLVDAQSNTQAKELADEIKRSSSNATQAISDVMDSTLQSLNALASSGNTVSSDALRVAQDGSSILSKLDSQMAIVRQGYQASLGKLQSDVPSQLQASLQQMMSSQSEFNSDFVQELLNENGGLGFISEVTDQHLSELGIGVDSTLASNRNNLAYRGVAVKGQVQDMSSGMNRNLQQVRLASAQASGNGQSALEGLAGTMSNSIDDLSSALDETASSGRQDWSQLSSSLASKNSESLQGVLGRIQGLADSSNSDLTQFVLGTMAIASNSTDENFDQISSLLSDLFDKQTNISLSHDSLISGAKMDHSQRMSALRALSKLLQSTSTQNMGAAKLLRSNMQGGIGQVRSRYTQQAAQAALDANSDATAAMKTLDQLSGSVNATFTNIHNSVSSSIADVGSNLNSASERIEDVEMSTTQSNSALKAAAYSILSASQADQSSDFSIIEKELTDAQSAFSEAIKTSASVETESALSGILASLNSTYQGQVSAKSYLSSLQNALDVIQTSLLSARKSSDRKSADFSTEIGDLKLNLVNSNTDVEKNLMDTMTQFALKLSEKEQSLNSTTEVLSSELNELKKMVLDAQQQLGQTLAAFESRIDGIVTQIRAYMNLSANADELAISHGIASQLATVNTSQVRLEAVRSGLDDRMSSLYTRGNNTQSANADMIFNIGASALSALNGSEEAKLSLVNSLTAVAGNVDASASGARDTLRGAQNFMSDLVRNNSATARSALSQARADLATGYSVITASSSDVNSLSRRTYLDNLFKLSALNDGLNMTASQLEQVLSSSKDSLNNVSVAAEDHFELARSKLNALRSKDAGKVASVSDVMAAFAAIVVHFLNETENAMKTSMKEMNYIHQTSQTKLVGVQRRTSDEVNYLNSVLNTSTQTFRYNLEQERAVQEALQEALAISKVKLLEEEKRERADIDSLVSQISHVEAQIKINGQNQLSKVRQWIQSRAAKKNSSYRITN